MRFLILLLSMLGASITQGGEIVVGLPAPVFTLPDQDGNPHNLSDYQGQWVVLYFYPKNKTPGCTTEACSFRDNINRLIAQEAVVLGVSMDSVESHAAFAAEHELPFDLLSDTEGVVVERYGALRNLLIARFAKRHSFIIDPVGNIARIYRDVHPEEHVYEVLADLEKLQQKQ